MRHHSKFTFNWGKKNKFQSRNGLYLTLCLQYSSQNIFSGNKYEIYCSNIFLNSLSHRINKWIWYVLAKLVWITIFIKTLWQVVKIVVFSGRSAVLGFVAHWCSALIGVVSFAWIVKEVDGRYGNEAGMWRSVVEVGFDEESRITVTQVNSQRQLLPVLSSIWHRLVYGCLPNASILCLLLIDD